MAKLAAPAACVPPHDTPHLMTATLLIQGLCSSNTYKNTQAAFATNKNVFEHI
jgi:hypothetical protein